MTKECQDWNLVLRECLQFCILYGIPPAASIATIPGVCAIATQWNNCLYYPPSCEHGALWRAGTGIDIFILSFSSLPLKFESKVHTFFAFSNVCPHQSLGGRFREKRFRAWIKVELVQVTSGDFPVYTTETLASSFFEEALNEIPMRRDLQAARQLGW